MCVSVCARADQPFRTYVRTYVHTYVRTYLVTLAMFCFKVHIQPIALLQSSALVAQSLCPSGLWRRGSQAAVAQQSDGFDAQELVKCVCGHTYVGS